MRALDQVAEDLATGTLEIRQARALAREATGGRVVRSATGPGRVLPSMRDSELQLAALAEYLNRHTPQDPRRWSATLVMVEALLGVGEIDADAGPVALSSARPLVERVIRASGSRCPAAAVPFALAMIDACAEHRACVDPVFIRELTTARAAYAACAKVG